MQTKQLLRAGVGLLLATFASVAFAQSKPVKPAARTSPDTGAASPKQIRNSSNELIEKTKASKESLEKLLAIYEKQLKNLSENYESRKKLYEKDLISKLELEESERTVVDTRLKIEQVRRWVAENDIALTEALVGQEMQRLPALPPGGYSETRALIRYNGGARWSVANAGKLEKFFSNRFGRALPVSARGQTPAHERMRFDHRDAMDVALYPDSEEGRELMNYLRKSGIPFMGFRERLAGSATGAHIHVGRPSIRVPPGGDSSSQ